MPGKRAAPRKQRKMRRMKNLRKRQSQTQIASIQETITFADLNISTPYDTIVDLSLFDRATDVADNFQEYRITKLDFKYTPLFDTYIDASGNVGITLPTLYHKRQVYPSPPSFGLPYMVSLGAKPIRIDDKIIRFSYTPNVLLNGTITNPSSATPLQKPDYKPWLSTHQTSGSNVVMDNTPHQGHALFIYQKTTAGVNSPICSYEVTAHFEFRKPWDKATVGGEPAQRPVKVDRVATN